MKPTKCPACGCDKLTSEPSATNEQFSFSTWKVIPLQMTACLECGVVTYHLDDANTERLRKWSSEEAKQKPPLWPWRRARAWLRKWSAQDAAPQKVTIDEL
jgi:hypothetical protein